MRLPAVQFGWLIGNGLTLGGVLDGQRIAGRRDAKRDKTKLRHTV